MATNQENQYELAIENFSFMTFHPCAISIFCNHTKADTSLQCMLKCSNFCKWWKGRNYVEYISLSMSNIYHQYREILPVGFNKLLDCSLKQSFFPHQLLQGAKTTSLWLFITNQFEPSQSAWSSAFPCHLQQISPTLSCYWRSVGKFRKMCEEHWFHFEAVISTFESSIIMNRCN